MGTDYSFPAWLKAMQNGSIGEARSRSFLLERFWVLERSVDIEGADFIIQRRLTSTNLLDKNPPRFGIVQSKFFASPQTTHYIHIEYLVDKDGAARREFFLLCHTGTEENAKAYLLTAEDLMRDFQENNGKVTVPGSALLGSMKYEVQSTKFALDRLERTLALAQFSENRRFVSWFLPSARLIKDNINPLYLEPLDNWWGDIPEGFLQIKGAAESAIGDLDDVRADLIKIVESSDPEQALSIAEDLYHSLRAGGRLYVSIPDEIYDQDLHSTVLQHKKKVLLLKEHGLLDSFLSIKPSLEAFAETDLEAHMPLDGNIVYRMKIKYEPLTFKNLTMASSFVEKAKVSQRELSSGWIESSTPGKILFCSMPGKFRIMEGKRPVKISFSHVLDRIYELRFPEEESKD